MESHRSYDMVCKVCFFRYGLLFVLLLLLTSRAGAQSGNALPLNRIPWGSIEVNGISFAELSKSQGDEGVIASLCQCPYTVLKSEDPDFPWAAYTLFEGERRLSVSFGGDGTQAMPISSLELLGAEATVGLNGVTLSPGDPMARLGQVQSRRHFGGGTLHYALFSSGVSDAFFHVDFDPGSGEIRKIGYLVPF